MSHDEVRSLFAVKHNLERSDDGHVKSKTPEEPRGKLMTRASSSGRAFAISDLSLYQTTFNADSHSPSSRGECLRRTTIGVF